MWTKPSLSWECVSKISVLCRGHLSKKQRSKLTPWHVTPPGICLTMRRHWWDQYGRIWHKGDWFRNPYGWVSEGSPLKQARRWCSWLTLFWISWILKVARENLNPDCPGVTNLQSGPSYVAKDSYKYGWPKIINLLKISWGFWVFAVVGLHGPQAWTL